MTYFRVLLQMTHKTLETMLVIKTERLTSCLIQQHSPHSIPNNGYSCVRSLANQPVYTSLSEDHGSFVRTGQNGENGHCGQTQTTWEGIHQEELEEHPGVLAGGASDFLTCHYAPGAHTQTHTHIRPGAKTRGSELKRAQRVAAVPHPCTTSAWRFVEGVQI